MTIVKKPFLTSLDKKPFLKEHGPEPFSRWEQPGELLIRDAVRPQAMYIAGKPGYGKSSLIQNLVVADVAAGHGVCVVDPSGTLIKKADEPSGIIDWIPENRIEDVIYFNTSDSIRSFDFFSYKDEDEKTVLLDELVALFKLENAPRAKPLLWKVLNILLTANHNGGKYVFTDIQTFIESPLKQQEMLNKAELEWPSVPRATEFEAITTRLIPFADDKVMRQVIASPNPEINLWDVMQSNKILLVDLNDTDRDYFIGSLIIAKIQQATFRRRIIPENLRKPFFLYIDEFHAIAPASGDHFEKMLTRARKYKLCLAMANPLPDDLPDPIVRKLPSVGVKILFNLSGSNAVVFKDDLLSHVSEDDHILEVESVNYLNYLPEFTAVCVQPRCVPTIVKTPKYLPPNPASYAREILKRGGGRTPCEEPPPTPHTGGHGSGGDNPQTLLPDRSKAKHPGRNSATRNDNG